MPHHYEAVLVCDVGTRRFRAETFDGAAKIAHDYWQWLIKANFDSAYQPVSVKIERIEDE